MTGRHAAPAVTARPVLLSGCEGCDVTATHHTRTEAVRACWDHWAETGHDPLVSTAAYGWHRIFLELEP